MSKFNIYPKFGQILLEKKKGKFKLLDGIDTNSILLNPSVNYVLELSKKENFKEGNKVIVLKDENEFKGILRFLTNEFVDIEIETVLCRIRDYSSILQEIETKIEKENDAIILESPSTLTYLFNQVSWEPIYTMNLKGDLASISCTANIYSKQKLEGDITLMAGTFKYLHHRTYFLNLEEETSSNIISEKCDEYHSYPLGEMEIQGLTPIHIFSEENLEVSKFYTHNVSENNIVQHGYSFETPRFLSSGDVYFYVDSNYIGSFLLKETLEDNFVELIIGPTSSISCISNIQIEDILDSGNSQEIKKVTITTQIYSEIENIDLTIKYHVGKATLIESSCPITERINDNLEWDVIIENTEKYLFETTLILSS